MSVGGGGGAGDEPADRSRRGLKYRNIVSKSKEIPREKRITRELESYIIYRTRRHPSVYIMNSQNTKPLYQSP